MDAAEASSAFARWMQDAPESRGDPSLSSDETVRTCSILSELGRTYPKCTTDDGSESLFETDDANEVRSIAAAIPSSDVTRRTAANAYLAFLQDNLIDKLIEAYHSRYGEIRPGEIYKWRAVKCFQQNWNLDAPDFPAMLDRALAKSGNLLAGSNFLPRNMLHNFASIDPERTRAALANLLDESKDLIARMKEFNGYASGMLARFNEQVLDEDGTSAKLTYQDIRAMNVYLTFAHPDRYFLYKNSMFRAAASLLGFNANEKTRGEALKYEHLLNYHIICERILKRLNAHYSALIEESDSSLPRDLREVDLNHHILVQDIIYFAELLTKEDWYPSEDYDPEITSEEWEGLLRDRSITTDNALLVLKRLLNCPDGATCTELAQRFGGSKNLYQSNITALARRVHNRTGCPILTESKGRQSLWAIICLGRPAEKEQLGSYVWRLRDEICEALDMLSPVDQPDGVVPEKEILGRNIILYGPPGTGKTYCVSSLAWLVSQGKEPTLKNARELTPQERRIAKAWYDTQVSNIDRGQAAFVTFHQSYGYEEFIEGIRPVVTSSDEGLEPSETLSYAYEDGVFKSFCKRAGQATDGERYLGLNESPSVWKVSLNGTGDNPVRTECLEQGHIRIGWDEYGPNVTDETDFSKHGGKTVLAAFLNKMRVGDLVLSCYSATTVDAVGVVTGEPEWHDEYQSLKRQRAVRWIAQGLSLDVVGTFHIPTMTLSTVYQLKLSAADVIATLDEAGAIQGGTPRGVLPHVFVIDEINRGNISKIFGELITLIEPSKRLGQPDEQSATLPYTGESFGVPSNVTIIGTMNTADRSIALMDTALRRRFDFIEMMPDYEALDEIPPIEGISVSEMLHRMNRRIDVLYDREHEIGHAYFMELVGDPTLVCLSRIFRHKVLPLLQEYFYDDYRKIRLVLADNQTQLTDEQFVLEQSSFSPYELFGDAEVSYEDIVTYELNEAAFDNPSSYQKIYTLAHND